MRGLDGSGEGIRGGVWRGGLVRGLVWQGHGKAIRGRRYRTLRQPCASPHSLTATTYTALSLSRGSGTLQFSFALDAGTAVYLHCLEHILSMWASACLEQPIQGQSQDDVLITGLRIDLTQSIELAKVAWEAARCVALQ